MVPRGERHKGATPGHAQRVAVGAPVATWEAAFQHCNEEHIAAWFSVSWEDRLA
jgi:hypothetical protein